MARDLGGRDPAELIRRASALAGRGGEREGHKALSNGDAREYAKDVLVEVIQTVLEKVSSQSLVEADERLAHLTDFEKGAVADLVDKARVTITCDFDWDTEEEDADGEH